MSKKSRDTYGNWKDITIGVRVSLREYKDISVAAAKEGKSIREYVCNRLQNSQIHCKKNERAYLMLKPYYDEVLKKLQRVREYKGKEEEKTQKSMNRKG